MLRGKITIPEDLWNNIIPTGSNYICDPPTTNTDIDFVIYTKKERELCLFLENRGFLTNYNDDYLGIEEGLFISYKKENLNLLLINDYPFFIRWVKATKLAKELNLLKKEDRIKLFRGILYDS